MSNWWIDRPLPVAGAFRMNRRERRAYRAGRVARFWWLRSEFFRRRFA